MTTRLKTLRAFRGFGWGGVLEQKWIAGGLAVVIATAVGGAVAFSNQNRSLTEWQTLEQVSSGIRSISPGMTPAGDLSNALIANKMTGSIRINKSTSKIYNTAGQVISPVGNGDNTFVITDPGLSQDRCALVLTNIPPVGYSSVTINGGTAITDFSQAIDGQAALSYCTVTTNAGNTVVLDGTL